MTVSRTEPKTGMSTTVVNVDSAGRLQPTLARRAVKGSSERARGEHVDWDEMRYILREDLAPTERTAGLHFALLAPTRGGKTTITTKGIIPVYSRVEVPVLVIDSTADPKLRDYGERMPRFGRKFTKVHRLTISDMSDESIMTVYRALNKAMNQGDMVVYVDELRHVADPKFMGLGKTLEHIWLFGGKHGVTLGAASQAPRWLPSSFYDQSKVHLLFRIRDLRSRKRVEEISGDTDALRPLLPDLPQYHFAYVSPEGDVITSKYKLGGSAQ